MSLPHTLLSLSAAVGLWWAGHGLSCTRPGLQAEASSPAFALPGSAYGSLMARLIRDSLYSYWHGGESAAPAAPVTPTQEAPPPPPPPGRFARKGMPTPPPPPSPVKASWLESQVDRLSRLEKSRTKRNSAFPLSATHRRYLDAAADVRLRLAYQLDPGDVFLYEILYYHTAFRATSQADAQSHLQALSWRAMTYGLRAGGSLSDALTGAGAAINLLNDQLRPENTQRDAMLVQRLWENLEQCLARYRDIHHAAQAEGWWENIPPVRRQELEDHAKLLTRIRDMVQRTLTKPVANP